MVSYTKPDIAYLKISATIPEGEMYKDDEFDFEGKPCQYLEKIYPDFGPEADHAKPYEISQGWIGNCGTIAHICGLSEAKNELTIGSMIYPSHRSENGLYLVRYSLGIHYYWVPIDSRVPTNPKKTRPLYAKPTTPDADHGYWGSLLEKAAAKLKGGWYKGLTNYDDGSHDNRHVWGWHWFPHQRINATTFETFEALIDEGGYGITTFPRKFIQERAGLVPGHAFAVVDAASIVDKDGFTHNLIRLENPWGGGSDFEDGLYHDNSEFWNLNPEFEYLRESTRQTGGSWWMSWEEYATTRENPTVGVLVPLPRPHQPFLRLFEYALDGSTLLDKRWVSYDYLKKHNIKGQFLDIYETTELTFMLKWLKKSNTPCHTRIFVASQNKEQETLVQIQYGWWGGRLVGTCTLEPGKYEVFPHTIDMHRDQGVMQIILAADKEFKMWGNL